MALWRVYLRGWNMADKMENRSAKAATEAAVIAKNGDAAMQEQMWKKFDAMLQEFLQMEQSSPAVERQPAKAAR
jgi:hypothetical protein